MTAVGTGIVSYIYCIEQPIVIGYLDFMMFLHPFFMQHTEDLTLVATCPVKPDQSVPDQCKSERFEFPMHPAAKPNLVVHFQTAKSFHE